MLLTGCQQLEWANLSLLLFILFFFPFFLSRKRERGSFQQPDDVAPRCLSLSMENADTKELAPL